MAAGGSGALAVKHADVIQTEETALKYVVSIDIFAIDPPG